MELYNALTQPEMIQVFTQFQVKMEGDAKKDTAALPDSFRMYELLELNLFFLLKSLKKGKQNTV